MFQETTCVERVPASGWRLFLSDEEAAPSLPPAVMEDDQAGPAYCSAALRYGPTDRGPAHFVPSRLKRASHPSAHHWRAHNDARLGRCYHCRKIRKLSRGSFEPVNGPGRDRRFVCFECHGKSPRWARRRKRGSYAAVGAAF
jgi:hypothetical protein